MFAPERFIPSQDEVLTCTSHPAPYEEAWKATHCGLDLTEAIDTVARVLDVPYAMASGLVWAEMNSAAVRRPPAAPSPRSSRPG